MQILYNRQVKQFEVMGNLRVSWHGMMDRAQAYSHIYLGSRPCYSFISYVHLGKSL
jgi:hypothetical protein